jgi:parallel beta-helix repeat protein
VDLNKQYGIHLISSNSNLILRNSFSNITTGSGACFEESMQNNFTENLVFANLDQGIQIMNSSRNILKNNTIYKNPNGIVVSGISEENLLIENVMCGGNFGIRVYGANNNTIAKNALSRNAAIGINLSLSAENNLLENEIYDCPEGILLEQCQDNNLSRNILQNNANGIMLLASNHNNLGENNITGCKTGINLDQSSYNSIRSNELSENNDGIIIMTSIQNNLTENTIQSKDAGISLTSSTGCNITGNSAHNCRQGIKMVDCSQNRLSFNYLSHNYEGIYLDEGVYPQQSSSNEIYLNAFIDNSRDVYSFISINSWSSLQALSYRFQGKSFKNQLGNYWHSSRMLDDNNDGISDLHHNIGTDIDENPLMELPALYETSLLKNGG